MDRGRPRRVGRPEKSWFFFPLPPPVLLFLSLFGCLLVEFWCQGDSNVNVWSSLFSPRNFLKNIKIDTSQPTVRAPWVIHPTSRPACLKSRSTSCGKGHVESDPLEPWRSSEDMATARAAAQDRREPQRRRHAQSCETLAAPKAARELHAHCRALALQTPPKFHERTTKRGKKERKLWRETEKHKILDPHFGER